MNSSVLAPPLRTAQAEASGATTAGRPPGWLWAPVVLGPVLVLAWWSRDGYFYWDDLMFSQRARENSFSVAYLRMGLFDHFSPLLRAEFWVLAHVFPGNFAIAHLVQVGLLTVAVLAFVLTVRTLFGRGWLALGLTLAFGQSLFILRLLQWWTATANLLPATIFELLTIAAYARFLASGRRRYVALSVLAECAALLCYEQAMLVVGYLLLLRLLVIEERLSPRACLGVLRRELWIWAAYLAPVIVAIVNYLALYYTPLPRPSAGDLGRFLGISVGETFLPSLVGVWAPEDGLESSRPLLMVAAALTLAVIAVTIARAPRAWRGWAFLAVGYAASALPLGLSRSGRAGPIIGHELWYQQSAAFLALLALGLALDPRYAGSPRLSLSWRAPVRPRTTLVLAVGVAFAAYQVGFARSARLMEDSWSPPRLSHAYLDTLRSELRRLDDPVIVDALVPPSVVEPQFWPYNRLDRVLPFFGARVRYDPGGLRVRDDGRLRPP